MKPSDLAQRAYEFGVAVVQFCKTLPDTPEGRRIRGQLTDSGTPDIGFCARPAVAKLADEAEQLRRIFTASQLTAKRRDR